MTKNLAPAELEHLETDLGLLPSDWNIAKLGDLIEPKGGKRLPKGHSFAGSQTKYPYIRIVDFANYSVKLHDLRYLTEEDRQTMKRYIITKEDVFISIAGTIGVVGTVPAGLDGANLTENASRLIIHHSERIDKAYLVFYLASPFGQKEIEIRTTKTSQPKLALMRIKEIPVPLPPLPEQKNIALILQTIREAREKTENVINSLKELEKSLRKHFFAHGVVSLEDVEKVGSKETEIGKMPEGWEVKKIGDLFETSKKPRGLKILAEEEIVFIAMENISDSYKEPKYETRKYSTVASGVFVQKGDLVIAKITPCFENGKQALLDNIPKDFAVATTEVIPLHPQDNAEVTTSYLYHYLKLPQARQKLASKMEGTTGRKRLSKTALNDFALPLPSLNEQKEITSILTAIDTKIQAEKTRKEAINELFKSMLHNLMTGKIRVHSLEA